jgi:hypothetical protein
MFKTLKVVAITLVAIAVIALTLYKGIPAVIGYIEGKAIAEVNDRQERERLNVQVDMADLTIEFNRDLSKEVASTTEYFNTVEDQIDDVIAKRQANAVELPATVVTGFHPVAPKPVANKPEPPKPQEDDISELSLAWQSFCKIRPSYKDCIEGTHP